MTVALLAPGMQTFFDAAGNPLVGGSVFMYVPGTTTPKTTWIDEAETTPNTNPIILDAAGRCIIWGDGSYRQVVFDQNGNQQWDQQIDTIEISDLGQQSADNVDITGGSIANVTITNATFVPSQPFPFGTRMLFMQATAPVGWVQDTSVNDAVLRLVNDNSGNGTGGSWTISGLTATTNVLGHTLTTAEIPPHTHTINPVVQQGSGPNFGNASTFTQLFSGGITSDGGNVGGGPHTHDATTGISANGAWRPAYINTLVASKS